MTVYMYSRLSVGHTSVFANALYVLVCCERKRSECERQPVFSSRVPAPPGCVPAPPGVFLPTGSPRRPVFFPCFEVALVKYGTVVEVYSRCSRVSGAADHHKLHKAHGC